MFNVEELIAYVKKFRDNNYEEYKRIYSEPLATGHKVACDRILDKIEELQEKATKELHDKQCIGVEVG